jgi:hypothetical protein
VLLLATVLVAPHLTVYDLVLLAPALLWISDWLIANRSHPATHRLGWLVYASYVLPLFGPLAKFTHVQLSVLAFAGLTAAVVTAASTRERRAMPSESSAAVA